VASARRTLVGVTGSNGYLGRSLVAALRTENLDVVEFRRVAPHAIGNETVRQLDLGAPMDSRVFEGVSCLVHAAWDLRETDPRRAWERNVEGSKRLLEAALDAGVERVIFVSSMSAYFGTKQDYGLMKLAVERAILESAQVVVRPGLVYGAQSGGMTSTLAKLARLPVIPVFRGAHQYTLHIDDFLAAMVALVRSNELPSSVIGLAHEPATPFKEIMLALAPGGDRAARTVAIPWHPLLATLRVGERLRFPMPVRSDSLLGLVRPAPGVPGRDVAHRLGLSFRPFSVERELRSQVE
jgi:nucleoside-diphosphate-sugar epimerase